MASRRYIGPARAATLASCLLFVVTAAAAQGLDHPGPAADRLGRAGATTANPGPSSAFIWNPALVGASLTRGGLQLSVGVGVDARQGRSRRMDVNRVDTAQAPLEPQLRPLATAASRLGVWRLALGFWYRQLAGAKAWFPGRDPSPPHAPGPHDHQRYGATSYQLTAHRFGLALGWHATKWLSLGAAVAGQWTRFRHERVLSAATTAPLEQQEDDVTGRLDLTARFTPLGIFGLFARPHHSLRLALAFEYGGVATLQGQAKIKPTDPDGGRARVLISEAAAQLEWRLPWVLRAAIGLDLGRVSIELEGRYISPGKPRPLVASSSGITIQTGGTQGPITDVAELPLGITLRPRFGLATALTVAIIRKRLWLSLGYGFEQGATSPQTRSAALIDPDRHLISVGLSVQLRRFRLDVGYARVHATWTGRADAARQGQLMDHALATAIGAAEQSRHGDLAGATLTFDMPFMN